MKVTTHRKQRNEKIEYERILIAIEGVIKTKLNALAEPDISNRETLILRDDIAYWRGQWAIVKAHEARS